MIALDAERLKSPDGGEALANTKKRGAHLTVTFCSVRSPSGSISCSS